VRRRRHVSTAVRIVGVVEDDVARWLAEWGAMRDNRYRVRVAPLDYFVRFAHYSTAHNHIYHQS
jgi:hypothetical protein